MASETHFACTVTRELPGFRLDAELSAGPGDVLSLFGASGSGKTMTLNTVAGTVRANSGRIVVGGEVLYDSAARVDLPPQARRVGYLPQQYALFPHLTVADNIAFGLQRLSRSQQKQRVVALLAQLRLDGLAARYPRQLSGGQQQRVALARALAINPRLLLLDEPFSALDAGLRADLREELALLHRQFPVTTLLVTHDLRDAVALSDRVAVYSHGRVLQLGSRDEVMHRPASVEAARLTGARNVLEGRLMVRESVPAVVLAGGHSLFCTGEGLPAAGAPVAAVVRPEYLRLLAPGDGAAEDESAVAGMVERALPQGAAVAVWVRLGGGGPLLEVAAPALEWARHPFAAGQPVQVAAPRWAVWIPPGAGPSLSS